MTKNIEPSSRSGIFTKPTHLIYLLGFFGVLHFTLPLYINSTFLETFMTTERVGLIYSLANFLSVLAVILFPFALNHIRNVVALICLFIFQIVTLSSLALGVSLPIILVAFIVYTIIFRIIVLNLDILLEKYSSDESTGGIRGTYLTVAAVAVICSPIIAGLLTGDDNNFSAVYLLALGSLVPAIFLISSLLHGENKRHQTLEPHRINIIKSLKKMFGSKDLSATFAAGLFLRFYFAWMVIYTPVYLVEQIGFDWTVLGVVFTIMLLPFALFEIPIGKIADNHLGEKELMRAGFIIMMIATALLVIPTEPNVIIWASILFLTRTGAAAVEITSETHFYKRIDENDNDLISIFKILAPLAYIIIPLFAGLVIGAIGLRFSYLVLVGVLFLGLLSVNRIVDTK